MTREELLIEITGTSTPRNLNDRENLIIDRCLNLINAKELVAEQPKTDNVLKFNVQDYHNRMREAANKILDNWSNKGMRNKLKKRYNLLYANDFHEWDKIFQEEAKKRN